MSLSALARGFLSANAAELVRMAVRFALVPLVLPRIGMAGYGTWLLLVALHAYLTAPTAGYNWAYVKFTAEHAHAPDGARLSAIIGAGIATLVTLTALMAGACWLAREPLLVALGVPADLLSASQPALAMLALAAVLRAAGGPALQVLVGLQRAELRYAIEIGESILYLVLSASLLAAGLDLTALAAAVLVSQVAATIVALGFCRRLRPQLSFSPWRATLSGARELFALGARFQVIVVVNTMSTSGLKMAISALAGVDALAVYHLADRLTTFARMPAYNLMLPLMPAFAHLTGEQQRARHSQLLKRGTRIVVALVLMPTLAVSVLAEPLLLAWTGQLSPAAVWTTRALALPTIVIAMSTVPAVSLRAVGAVGLETRLLIAEAVGMLAGALLGYSFYDYAGIVMGLVFARVGARLWFLLSVQQRAAQPMVASFVAAAIRACAALLPAAFAAAAMASWLLPGGGPQTRAALLPRLAIVGVAYGAAAIPAVWMLVLSAQERQLLVSRLRQIRASRRQRESDAAV